MNRNERRISKFVPAAGLAEANGVKIEVYFNNGGINYSNYKTEPRGIYGIVRPTKLETVVGFCQTESYSPFDSRGRRVFLEPAKRFNAKRLKLIAERVFAFQSSLTTFVQTGQYDAAANTLVTASKFDGVLPESNGREPRLIAVA